MLSVFPANYENAATFDGFRFARERAEHVAQHDANNANVQDIFKRHMISTAVDHLPFGTGKHACPVSNCESQLDFLFLPNDP
jgi:cytochrome P450